MDVPSEGRPRIEGTTHGLCIHQVFMTPIGSQLGERRERRVAVIGGGVGGLCAAFRCALAGDQVAVFEASPHFGGSIRTSLDGGFVLEAGAEGFPANSCAVRELARELGIDTEIREQRVETSFEYDGAQLCPLDPGEAAARLGLSGRSTRGQGVATFRLGMQQLIDTLVERLRAHGELRANTPIVAVSPSASGHGWRLDGPEVARDFDAVILAGTGKTVAELLGDVFGSAARDLAQARRIPSLTVSLAYSAEAIRHPLDATGFIPGSEVALDGCVACTFTSSKFAERAPTHTKLLRLFFRPTEDDFAKDLDCLNARATRIIERVFPGAGAPLAIWQARWPEGFPLIDATQRAAVARLEDALGSRGVVLAGASFHGSGIDAAVRSANAAAQQLRSSNTRKQSFEASAR